jgi:S1-C subfamily serine protease
LRPLAAGEQGRNHLFVGPRVRIGRSRDNDLVLPDRPVPTSSSRHAEAVLDAEGIWSIIDSGSANGTRVNGIVVQRQRLKHGDRIAFGDEQFVVSIGEAKNQRRALIAIVFGVIVTAAAGLIVFRASNVANFEAVASTAAPSVFMIAIETGGSRSMIGSGFAVTADGWLATNAHIADVLDRTIGSSGDRSGRAIAVQGDTYDVFPIGATLIDPAWKKGSLAHDVALVKLDGKVSTQPLSLADPATAAALARGAPIAAFGFPAVSTDPARPRGRLSVDVIGDVRGDYLEVGLGISPGMSGCPVLSRRGAVIAIVVGGDFVEMPDGIARPSGSSANWALSASIVRNLMERRR